MKALKMAKLIITIDRLINDYKLSGCGNCKRVANALNKELLIIAKQFIDENEN